MTSIELPMICRNASAPSRGVNSSKPDASPSDERDRVADERDRIAEDRDQAADERERQADEREGATDQTCGGRNPPGDRRASAVATLTSMGGALS
ncbi:hypothetical protein [Mycolicibacter senuensis]|uniref:hypothetical protein n=1 Tax=Mycolicibacter senuensis TaxID=386913 RepID=UPI0010576BF9|nr:hypothetical protein [Mycolicibacter senuensis]